MTDAAPPRKRRIAVVLFNLGGPDGPKAVRPFLRNLFADPAIITAPAVLRLPLAMLIARLRERSAKANYAIVQFSAIVANVSTVGTGTTTITATCKVASVCGSLTGATTVTVLQLALAYAALANGGTLYQPQLVRAVETSNGTVVQEFSPRVRRQIDINPENLKRVQNALAALCVARYFGVDDPRALAKHLGDVSQKAGPLGSVRYSEQMAIAIDSTAPAR